VGGWKSSISGRGLIKNIHILKKISSSIKNTPYPKAQLALQLPTAMAAVLSVEALAKAEKMKIFDFQAELNKRYNK
jgi:hypothetical protein